MKKIIKILSAILAVVVMLSSFAACGTKTKSSQDDTTTTASSDKDVLIMATNAQFPPYEYYEGKKVVGIDAEIAQKIADKLGMELKIEDMEFGSIIAAVQTGKVNMGMAGLTVTDERKKSVNFTDSYATGVQVVIVKTDSSIKSIDDLNSKMIGVQQDTTGDIYASDTTENGGFGKDHVTSYKSGAEAVSALKSGKVDAVIIDNEPAKSYVKANTGLKILKTEYISENYAICVSKKDTEMLNKINDALKQLKADGTVQKIIDKYIAAE